MIELVFLTGVRLGADVSKSFLHIRANISGIVFICLLAVDFFFEVDLEAFEYSGRRRVAASNARFQARHTCSSRKRIGIPTPSRPRIIVCCSLENRKLTTGVRLTSHDHFRHCNSYLII